MFDDAFSVRRRKLAIEDRIAQAQFDEVVNRIGAASETDILTIEPILVRRSGRSSILIRTLPVSRPASTPFLGARVILTLADLDRVRTIEDGILRRLFGLTPAEERLGRQLANGLSLIDAADASRITRETVRVQLKAIFAKTGTHRQSDLIAVLSRL